MKPRHFIVFLSFIQLPLTPASAIVIDETRLKKIAEEEGYGYKYANLKLSQELVDEFNLKQHPYKLAIPAFEGIPSPNIQDFLGPDLLKQWVDIIRRHFPSEESKQNTLRRKEFPNGFLKEASDFESRALQTFNPRGVSLDATFHVHGVDALVEKVGQAGEKLMVRSTGKEDTRKLANAGGNESVSNVSPEYRAGVAAMSQVVASYFGHKSLTQRLGAGDASLFDTTPFTPVLIQRMIGETQDELPKCGVMFTEEPEGGISKLEIKRANGRVQTTGITVIQSAYGHNEGVVNSLIPVDTFYVDDHNNIYPVIRIKTHRMVPVGEGKLEQIRNPEAQARAPALSRDAVLTLRAFADALEEFYLWPMDMEFVVKEHEKTIYMVQARPITHSTERVEPSYLLRVDEILAENKVLGSAIGVAGGALRTVNQADEIIVKDSIGTALKSYQDDKEVPDPKRINAVTVGSMAPSTSHEATTFRGESKPVVYSDAWRQVEGWVKESAKLTVSPQQGLIVHAPIESLNTAKGWVDYPVPSVVSLISEFLPTRTDFAALVRETPGIADALKVVSAEYKKRKPGVPALKWLFERMRFGTKAEATASLVVALNNLERWMKARTNLDHTSQEFLKLIDRYATEFAARVIPTLDYDPLSIDFTKRLLPIHFLETLFFQPLQSDIINNISVVSFLLSWLGEEQKVKTELGQQNIDLGYWTTKLALARDLAFTPELSTEWVKFLVEMRLSNPMVKSTFGTLFAKLSELDALPVWLHTSFLKKAEEQKPAAVKIVELYGEFSAQKAFLGTLYEKNLAVESFKMAAFEDPKKFATQWASFENDILNYFADDAFKQRYATANDFARLMALQVMARAVDVFDQSIKTLTGSVPYKQKTAEQLKNFHAMLLGYRKLAYIWLELVKEGSLGFNARGSRNLEAYKKLIDDVLDKPVSTDPKMFRAGSLFNVIAVTIGNGTVVAQNRVVRPSTYEETFMTIHQWLLVILQVLNKDAGIASVPRPPLLARAEEQLARGLRVGASVPSLVGVNLRKNVMTVLYNLALSAHSMQYELTYDKRAQNVIAEFRFFGRADPRWELIADFVKGLDRQFKIISQASTLNSVSIQLVVTENSPIPILVRSIQASGDVTMGNGEKFLQDGYAGLFDKPLEGIEVFASNINKEVKGWSRYVWPLDKLVKETKVKDVRLVKEVTDAVVKSLETPGSYSTFSSNKTQTKASELLLRLVALGSPYAQEAALAIAASWMMNTKETSREALSAGEQREIALILFGALLAAGYAPSVERAGQIAEESIAQPQLRLSGLMLFKTLADNGHFFDDALAAAERFAGGDEKEKNQCLNIFLALLKKKFEPAELPAKNAALENLFSISTTLTSKADQIFKAAGVDAMAFARETAQNEMQHNSVESKKKALKLYVRIVLRDPPARDIAAQAARATLLDANPDVRHDALSLFKLLVEKDAVRFAPAMLAVAQEALQSQDIRFVTTGFSALQDLIEKTAGKGEIHNQVMEVAKKAVADHANSTSKDLREEAKYLQMTIDDYP